MKTLKKAMAAIFSLVMFFACESEDVTPINTTAPKVTAVEFDQDSSVDQRYKDSLYQLDEKESNHPRYDSQ